MAQKVQMPAKKPAMAPQAISGFGEHSEGQLTGVARNMARLTAINKEKISVKLKIFPLFPPFLICSSVKWLSFIQAFPNKPGEYHTPPTTKEEIPATSTAHQFIKGIIISKKFFIKPPAYIVITAYGEPRHVLWLFQIYLLIFTPSTKRESGWKSRRSISIISRSKK